MSAPVTTGLMHGSAVAFDLGDIWAGLLIIGRPGAGKSELALELMALGAKLVSDDQTHVRREDRTICLSAPDQIRGMIEMRGMGILRAETVARARLSVVVDLDEVETRRLPARQWLDIHGEKVPRLRNCASRAFAAGLKQYVLSRQWQTELDVEP